MQLHVIFYLCYRSSHAPFVLNSGQVLVITEYVHLVVVTYSVGGRSMKVKKEGKIPLIHRRVLF